MDYRKCALKSFIKIKTTSPSVVIFLTWIDKLLTWSAKFVKVREETWNCASIKNYANEAPPTYASRWGQGESSSNDIDLYQKQIQKLLLMREEKLFAFHLTYYLI